MPAYMTISRGYSTPWRRAALACLSALGVIALSVHAHAAGQTDYVLLSNPASERAHGFRGSGSRLERCGGRVGLRQEYYVCRTTPAVVPEPKNLALNLARTGSPKPTAGSTSDGYDLWGPLDGADGTWTNASTDKDSSYWDLDFGKPTLIGKVMVRTWKAYALKDFDLLRWDEARNDWDRAQPIARIRGNSDRLVTITGLRVTTRRLRMLCLNGPDHQAMFRRIEEFQVYAPYAAPARFEPNYLSYQVKTPTSGRWTLEVQEVNDDRHNGDLTRYRVLVDGKSVYLRDFADSGPGLITYFVDIPATGRPFARVTLKDTSGFGMRVRSLRVYSEFEAYCRTSRLVTPMVICQRLPSFNPQKGFDLPTIDRWLDVFAKEGAPDKIGFAVDFAYLQRGPDHVKALADAIGKLVLDKNVQVVLGYPTTWSFSPLNTPDGNGKTFRAIEYQQIGYSKFDNYDDPGLKEYMDSCKPGWYDVHYGLTIPNHWSSVPWLTMNNKRLNAARQKGIAGCMAAINPWLAEMERRGASGRLLGLIGEDEPVYWTKIVDVFADGYGRVNGGVPRNDLLLDFNWSVVQDAARDGVKLDPADGLDATEKMWLHVNLAHYNQMIASAIRQNIRKEAVVVRKGRMEFPKDDRAVNQYVYWTGGKGYPLDDRFHPIWECSVLPQAGVGLGKVDLSVYQRARELGRVANSDFESRNNKKTEDWIPILKGFYEGGVRFSHHTNPGDPENWAPVARFLANPTQEMERRRMESLLITWRRDTENLIAEMASQSGAEASLLRRARRLLDGGRYRNAYEEAMKAKSVALPATYQIESSGELWPHAVTVSGSGEVTIIRLGSQLSIRTASQQPMRLTVRNLPPAARFILHPTDKVAASSLAVDASGGLAVEIPAGNYTIESYEQKIQ